jgi:hypothetical protein
MTSSAARFRRPCQSWPRPATAGSVLPGAVQHGRRHLGDGLSAGHLLTGSDGLVLPAAAAAGDHRLVAILPSR